MDITREEYIEWLESKGFMDFNGSIYVVYGIGNIYISTMDNGTCYYSLERWGKIVTKRFLSLSDSKEFVEQLLADRSTWIGRMKLNLTKT